jgi:hypothetical protein
MAKGIHTEKEGKRETNTEARRAGFPSFPTSLRRHQRPHPISRMPGGACVYKYLDEGSASHVSVGLLSVGGVGLSASRGRARSTSENKRFLWPNRGCSIRGEAGTSSTGNNTQRHYPWRQATLRYPDSSSLSACPSHLPFMPPAPLLRSWRAGRQGGTPTPAAPNSSIMPPAMR